MQSWMIGLVAGMIFTGWWAELPAWPVASSLAVISAGLLVYRRSAAVRFISGLTCGCALGIAHGTWLLDSRLSQDCVGELIVITGQVSSLPAASRVLGDRLRQRFEFSVASVSPGQCAGPQKLMLSYYGEDIIHPGAHWQFEAKLKRPWGLANPGSYNMQVWFAQHGIDGVGNVRASTGTHLLAVPAASYFLPDQLRQTISNRISELQLDANVTAILRAITVADSAAVDTKLWQLFQQYGINHLLVISGLHIGMVAAVGYLLGGLLFRLLPGLVAGANWLPGSVAVLLAGFYTALAGFSIPTQRAWCMLACFVVVRVAGRTTSSANNLLLAATVVLLLNPLAALGSGFWLSFGAVATLLWLSRWQRGMGACSRLLTTHAGMSLMMLPLGAYFFGGGSIVSMLANLVMIPLVGWFIVPVALLAVVSFLFGWPIEATLWQLAGWPLEILLPLASSLAQGGGDWLYVQFAAGFVTVVLGVTAVLLVSLPGRWSTSALAVVLALPLILPKDLAAQSPSLDTLITVLDVGQGTALVIQSGDRALLYDTGGGDPNGVNMGNSAVLPYLKYRGIRSLDTMIISHPDLDHSAGAMTVLNAMGVERLRYGRTSPGAGGGRACVAGESWRWPGGQTFQLLSPALETPPHSNDSSCVLRVQIGDYFLLLPGDIEWQRERTLVAYWGGALHSDWLLAGHHGSQTSSSLTFLKHVSPAVAVMSNGYANRFGHPHPSVVRRLQQQDVDIFSTETGGALEFSIPSGGLPQVAAYRQRVRRYWM